MLSLLFSSFRLSSVSIRRGLVEPVLKVRKSLKDRMEIATTDQAM